MYAPQYISIIFIYFGLYHNNPNLTTSIPKPEINKNYKIIIKITKLLAINYG